MEFYWNNVTEKSGLLKPSDITDCTVYARPLYTRFTVLPTEPVACKKNFSLIPLTFVPFVTFTGIW
jgi:hypothetical protein